MTDLPNSPYLDRPLKTLREVAAARREKAVAAEARWATVRARHLDNDAHLEVIAAGSECLDAWQAWWSALNEIEATAASKRTAEAA